ncbi:MAG TPA: hypothetical protein VFQ74_07185 [Pseudolysinimonas sp.]|nr:hypothetical protein [Pseudolysinimonas sp.]
METRDLFLASDGAMRDVVSRLTPADLDHPVPADWSRTPVSTLRDILALHASDEAWVPDVIAGKTIEEVGDRWTGDLLGDDPLGNYQALNLAAEEAALNEFLDVDVTIAHFSYGDYPLREGFLHLAVYRAFQAWMIARLVGMDYSLPSQVVDGMNEWVIPHLADWRAIGVFPPAQDVPEGADAESTLLHTVGFWMPPAAPLA